MISLKTFVIVVCKNTNNGEKILAKLPTIYQIAKNNKKSYDKIFLCRCLHSTANSVHKSFLRDTDNSRKFFFRIT